jgi:hypothetical protein
VRPVRTGRGRDARPVCTDGRGRRGKGGGRDVRPIRTGGGRGAGERLQPFVEEGARGGEGGDREVGGGVVCVALCRARRDALSGSGRRVRRAQRERPEGESRSKTSARVARKVGSAHAERPRGLLPGERGGLTRRPAVRLLRRHRLCLGDDLPKASCVISKEYQLSLHLAVHPIA